MPLLLLLAAPIATSAADWTRTCKFVIQADQGTIPGSALYWTVGTPDLLVRVAENSWFLLRPAIQEFHALTPEAVEARSDGTMALLATPTGAGEPLALERGQLRLEVAGQSFRVILTPDLMGATTPEAFLGLCHEYEDRARAYTPNPLAVEMLAASGRELTLVIYFGSWCPHCQEVLPRLFKSLQAADNAKLKVEMIGLSREFAVEPLAQEHRIERVPTVIVMEGDAEIGRLHGGAEEGAIEEALAAMVGG